MLTPESSTALKLDQQGLTPALSHNDNGKVALPPHSPAERRKRLLHAGYMPLPIIGKRPPFKGWTLKTETNDGEIDIWSKVFPDAKSTGLQTRKLPTLDLDILDEQAVEAAEQLVRERFEEKGYILVRIGRPPKRAIPFRTNDPFKKILVNLIAPNGSEEKIELLADGQQLVSFGLHEDTGLPYRWFGGEPGAIKREDLPYIHEAEAQQLVDEIADLLCRDFGYQRAKERPKKSGKADDASTGEAADDWAYLTKNVQDGRQLHDSLRDLAAKFITSGMSVGATINYLRGLMKDAKPQAEWDERWKARYADIPRLVESAAETKEPTKEPEQKTNGKADGSSPALIKSSKQFVSGFIPPDYIVDGLLQEGFLYSLTGATGAGKTAIDLRLAASVALGDLFANRETKKKCVLYFAAENPDDVRMRWIALSQHMDFDVDTIEVFFIEGVFKISQMTAALRQEAKRIGGEFGLIIIDTSPAFYEGDEENNRVQQGNHAKMLRGLINIIPGRPTIIANCHPVKNAGPDNLLPAGGGTFLNEVDGNLTASKTDNTTELHWQGKFRGVEFAPMHFTLKTVTHDRLKDKKQRLIPTVICEWISDNTKEEIAAQKLARRGSVVDVHQGRSESLAIQSGDQNRLEAL